MKKKKLLFNVRQLFAAGILFLGIFLLSIKAFSQSNLDAISTPGFMMNDNFMTLRMPGKINVATEHFTY